MFSSTAQCSTLRFGLVSLEKQNEVIIITQNIDDLARKRAGSSNVLHLHGEITKMRSQLNDDQVYPYERDIQY